MGNQRSIKAIAIICLFIFIFLLFISENSPMITPLEVIALLFGAVSLICTIIYMINDNKNVKSIKDEQNRI
jgi:4-hydroxybenzoate polyprenyltransferase